MYHYTYTDSWMRQQLTDRGVNRNMTLMTQWGLYDRRDGMYDTSTISERVCERVASRGFSGPICLDIEAFDFDDEGFDAHTAEFEKALRIYRHHNAGSRIGFYMFLPFRNFWTPVNYRNSTVVHRRHQEYRDRWIAWRQKNAKHRAEQEGGKRVGTQGLADKVDVVFPSLYTFYNNQDAWEIYANENLIEAAKYGKPMLVWLWPVYHGSNKDLAGKYIGTEFLRRQLEMCQRHGVEGICWFSPGTSSVSQDEWADLVASFS